MVPAQASDEPLARVRNDGTVRIGFRAGAVPFSYTLPGTPKPVGYAIDICERAIDELRKSLKMPRLAIEFVPVDNQERFTALAAGKIDMECANTTITRDRRAKGFGFSLPYFMTGSRVMARSALNAGGIKDLAGSTVILMEGTTTAAIVRNNFPTFKYVSAPKRALALELLESGKADALVEDDTVLYGLRAASKTPTAYTVIGSYLSIEPFAVMLPQGDSQLKPVLDRTLRDMIRSGELTALHKRWFQSPIPPRGDVLDIPMAFLMRDFMRFPVDDTNAYP